MEDNQIFSLTKIYKNLVLFSFMKFNLTLLILFDTLILVLKTNFQKVDCPRTL